MCTIVADRSPTLPLTPRVTHVHRGALQRIIPRLNRAVHRRVRLRITRLLHRKPSNAAPLNKLRFPLNLQVVQLIAAAAQATIFI